MRALWVSILSLVLVIGVYVFFCVHAQNELSGMADRCQGAIMDAVEDEDWETAGDAFRQEYENWQDFRKTALLFLDTDSINETDQTFAKTLKYIKAEDRSNGSGELLALVQQLRLLHENESITWQNIL